MKRSLCLAFALLLGAACFAAEQTYSRAEYDAMEKGFAES